MTVHKFEFCNSSKGLCECGEPRLSKVHTPEINGSMTKFEAAKIFDELSGAEMDVLLQLRSVRWDGFIASKVGRDKLLDKGLATRYDGYTTLTVNGLILLAQAGRLESLTSGKMSVNGK